MKHRRKLLRFAFVIMIMYILYCNYFGADDMISYAKTIQDVQIEQTAVALLTTTPTAIVVADTNAAKKITESKAFKREKSKVAYINSYVIARKKASKKSSKKFLLKPKQKVKILKKTKKWAKVVSNKKVGYVPNKTLSHTQKKAMAVVKKRAVSYKLTGYCSCYSCSEGWGTTTVSGRKAKANHTIAADLAVLPLYTEVYIEGMGIYTVEDKGGGVSGRHIDVYCNKHSQCYSIKSNAKVFVIE